MLTLIEGCQGSAANPLEQPPRGPVDAPEWLIVHKMDWGSHYGCSGAIICS